MENPSRPSWRLWTLAGIVAIVGVSWQYTSLTLIEGLVKNFPSVPDVLMDRLPRIDFGIFGELWFFGLILVFAIPHFRSNWKTTPRVLIALGLMYFIRGWIMFFFPIGMPAGAVSAAERLSIWGHEAHAYFPGGHIAILTILTLFTASPRVRKILWPGLIVFGFGTLLSKNHYTVDSITGMLLGYFCATWVQGKFTTKTSRED